MSDTRDTHTNDHEPPTAADQSLDQMLHSAEWPEAGAASLARLGSSWDALAGDLRSERSELANVGMPASAGRASGRRRTVAVVVVATAIAVVAFWVGRTTAPAQPKNIADSRGTNAAGESVGRSLSPSNLNPSDSPDGRDTASETQAVVVNEMPALGVGDANVTSPDADRTQSVPDTDSLSPSLPEVDAVRRNRRGVALAQRKRDSEQLDAVLACLIDQPDADATCCLPLMRRRAAFEYLLWEVVQNATGRRRMAAVTAIGFVGTTESIPRLIQTTETSELRDVAIQALKRQADERLLASIAGQREDLDVAREFAIELVQRDSPTAAKALLELVRDPRTRSLSLEIVDEASEAAVELWYAAFDSSLVSDRVAAALVLGRRSDARTHQRLRHLVSTHPTRWEPVAALMASGSEEAMKTLLLLQQQPERFAVIQTAAVQLQSLPGPGAAADRSR